MNLKSLISALVFIALSGIGIAEEVVIHRGREMHMASPSGDGPAFQEIYYADKALMDRQPTVDIRAADPPLSIAQAAATVAKHKNFVRVVVLQAKMLNYAWESGNKKGNFLQGVLFYTLELLTPTSISEFVVLMDGTVIESRREDKKPDKAGKP